MSVKKECTCCDNPDGSDKCTACLKIEICYKQDMILHKRYLESVLAWHDGTYNQYRAKDKKNSISLDNAIQGLKRFLKDE